jgi:hypothetical protein
MASKNHRKTIGKWWFKTTFYGGLMGFNMGFNMGFTRPGKLT